MRKPPGKQLGYFILPIAITAGLDPATALDKNTDYDAVWEVLRALRAHDERFIRLVTSAVDGAGHSPSLTGDGVALHLDVDSPVAVADGDDAARATYTLAGLAAALLLALRRFRAVGTLSERSTNPNSSRSLPASPGL